MGSSSHGLIYCCQACQHLVVSPGLPALGESFLLSSDVRCVWGWALGVFIQTLVEIFDWKRDVVAVNRKLIQLPLFPTSPSSWYSFFQCLPSHCPCQACETVLVRLDASSSRCTSLTTNFHPVDLPCSTRACRDIVVGHGTQSQYVGVLRFPVVRCHLMYILLWF